MVFSSTVKPNKAWSRVDALSSLSAAQPLSAPPTSIDLAGYTPGDTTILKAPEAYAWMSHLPSPKSPGHRAPLLPVQTKLVMQPCTRVVPTTV